MPKTNPGWLSCRARMLRCWQPLYKESHGNAAKDFRAWASTIRAVSKTTNPVPARTATKQKGRWPLDESSSIEHWRFACRRSQKTTCELPNLFAHRNILILSGRNLSRTRQGHPPDKVDLFTGLPAEYGA